jgi:hypothetical protein
MCEENSQVVIDYLGTRIFDLLGGNEKFLKKLLHFLIVFYILNVTELPKVFLTLGTKLSLALSFFTLRSRFMDLKKPLSFDEQLDKIQTKSFRQ